MVFSILGILESWNLGILESWNIKSKIPKNPFSQNYFTFSKNGHKKYVHFSIPQNSLPKKEFFLI
jgi:hypothetical protein